MCYRLFAVCAAVVGAIFFITATNTGAQEEKIIKEIEFEGLVRTKEKIVRFQIKSKVGDKYSKETVTADEKRLIETGYFTNVTVSAQDVPGGIRLIFSFQEKPTLRAIIFTGNQKIPTKRLRKKIKLKSGEIFDEVELNEGIIEIADLYEKKGFYEASVDYKPEIDVEANEVTVEIIISEGRRVKIKKIEIVGNKNIEVRKIRRVMKTKRRSFFSFLTGKGKLNPDILDEDLFRIKALYRIKGYLDIKIVDVKETPLEKPEPEWIMLTITIDEGQQYKVGNIAIKGNVIFKTEEIAKRLILKKGDVLSAETAEKEKDQVRDFYQEKGYIDARIDAMYVPTEQPDVLDVIYNVTENREIKIGKIDIIGNIVTKDKVIRRELAVHPGEVYNSVKIRRSISRLRNLGYFSDVNIYTQQTPIEDVRDLVIEVKEQRTGQLLFGAGFSSIDKLVGSFEIVQSNFDIKNWPTLRGGGQKIRIKTDIGTKRKDLILSFIEPWLFDYRLLFGFDIYKHEKQYLSAVYEQETLGFDVKLGKELFRRTRGVLTYRRDRVEIFPEPEASELIQREAGKKYVSSLRLDIIGDTRDNFLFPTKGIRSSISSTVAGGVLGGDRDFHREELRASAYLSIYKGHIIRFRGHIGSVEEFGDSEDVPIFERFFLGGRTTVRGFEYRKVGPKDETGEPIGGKSSLFLSVEYNFPIINVFRGAVFYDTGNVWSDAYHYDLGDLRAGAGVGLRIMIPVAGRAIPINLDYSWPIDRDEFVGPSPRFDFLIGASF